MEDRIWIAWTSSRSRPGSAARSHVFRAFSHAASMPGCPIPMNRFILCQRANPIEARDLRVTACPGVPSGFAGGIQRCTVASDETLRQRGEAAATNPPPQPGASGCELIVLAHGHCRPCAQPDIPVSPPWCTERLGRYRSTRSGSGMRHAPTLQCVALRDDATRPRKELDGALRWDCFALVASLVPSEETQCHWTSLASWRLAGCSFLDHFGLRDHRDRSHGCRALRALRDIDPHGYRSPAHRKPISGRGIGGSLGA